MCHVSGVMCNIFFLWDYLVEDLLSTGPTLSSFIGTSLPSWWPVPPPPWTCVAPSRWQSCKGEQRGPATWGVVSTRSRMSTGPLKGLVQNSFCSFTFIWSRYALARGDYQTLWGPLESAQPNYSCNYLHSLSLVCMVDVIKPIWSLEWTKSLFWLFIKPY